MAATTVASRASRRSARQGSARAQIVGSSERFWHRGELPGSPKTISNVFSELVREGELFPVRRGVYWRGVKTPLGMSPPPDSAVVAELVGNMKGVGPAGLSAASALRLSTQVPRFRQIAVPGRAPVGTSTMKFLTRSARPGRVKADLNGLEVAFLEVLGDLSVSELSAQLSWNRLLEVLGSESVRPDKLAVAAVTEPGVTRARLRAMLTSCGRGRLSAQIPPADKRTAARALDFEHEK
ncbi:hypothetical protein [Rhodococcus sp. IEGM 1379]|uniref:hypothetical protein n=1 Tax=Rhodococcus sp. IEGM 1379 TaxID=3047086 RepID=UPI0024B7F48A|nr:hypothetical protein [Rhodococcus sp. IEGM 1379]MDI9917749.1 hypothetical protein [Rhodococcus sp. IEGM 1379]